MKLIGLTGLAGSGKTTVSRYLQRNYCFSTLRFAGPLKAMLWTLYENATDQFFTDVDIARRIDGDLKEEHCPIIGTTPRHAMQTLGTEWGRNCMSDDFWLRIASGRIDSARGRLVIDDLRFANEGDMIRSKGGIVIAIDRPGVIVTGGDHPSENVVKADASITNDGTLEQLQAQVDRLVSS